MKLTRRQTLKLLGCAGPAWLGPHAFGAGEPIDLVVYGATASGVMTAYSAAREGLNVVVLERGTHVGGMVTGGLSATDPGHYPIIGGYARDFYQKAAAHYEVNNLDQPANWLSEPHVDMAIFRSMLQEAGVRLFFQEELVEQGGVELRNKKIASISTSNGKHWQAKIFADCSYGDFDPHASAKAPAAQCGASPGAGISLNNISLRTEENGRRSVCRPAYGPGVGSCTPGYQSRPRIRMIAIPSKATCRWRIKDEMTIPESAVILLLARPRGGDSLSTRIGADPDFRPHTTLLVDLKNPATRGTKSTRLTYLNSSDAGVWAPATAFVLRQTIVY